ncbi:MAG: hypothetical protein NXI12_06365 [Alphaproteobacteria bacterium]|nr:hypothetical protein [Alphaproteobacteria bacterium]
MILSRLSKSIREQNYYAVALEFVIVIAGVVIGFQIQGWNEARGERAREAAYLQRLHIEIEELVITREGRVARRERTKADLVEFVDMLEGRSAAPPGDAHCNAIGRSFIVSYPTDSIAVIDEILSVGALDTIRSSEVRAAVSNYLLITRRARDANEFSEAISVVLSERFPHLISVSAASVGNGLLGTEYECDFDGMRADASFGNAFAINAFGYTSHTHQNGLVDQALEALHAAVDQALGLSPGHDRAPEVAP